MKNLKNFSPNFNILGLIEVSVALAESNLTSIIDAFLLRATTILVLFDSSNN